MISLDDIQTFCIDESDQLLLPSKSQYCSYFETTDERADFGDLDSQLLAIFDNMKLLQYGIEKKKDGKTDISKPQIILTSAQVVFQSIDSRI